MKKISKVALGLSALMLLTTGALHADVKKGQRIYLKKLKAPCGFNGAKFAIKHTQDEWEELKEAGKFDDEIKKLCPKVKIEKLKEKHLDYLYDFVYEYAKDSGKVPSCG